MQIINYTIGILLISISAYAGEPMIVAHRGASHEAPQNTIPAFKLAWAQGADAIEGDFHLTKDGHIVCIHDGNTEEVAKTNLVVRNSTLSELRKLDVGARKDKTFKATRIPIISQVFSTIPDKKKIFIEIKCGIEIIPALLNEINKSRLTKEQIVFISFNAKVLQELKAKLPNYKVYWLCSFKQKKTKETTPSLEVVLNTLRAIEANGLSSNTAIPHSVIDTVKQLGYEWHVWTVNNLAEAKRMSNLGAKSITTDVPGLMKRHFVEKSPEDDTQKPNPKK